MLPFLIQEPYMQNSVFLKHKSVITFVVLFVRYFKLTRNMWLHSLWVWSVFSIKECIPLKIVLLLFQNVPISPLFTLLLFQVHIDFT